MGGQGEQDLPGREMNKHSDVKAESSKRFLESPTVQFGLRTELGKGEKRK